MKGEAMRDGVITEADTCREFVTPRLVEAGWGAAPYSVGEQRSRTNGRIIVAGGKVRRGKQKREYEEGPQAWKVDFAAKREASVAAATPHWQRAESHRNAAIRCQEAEVMRLLGEIEALVAEVQA